MENIEKQYKSPLHFTIVMLGYNCRPWIEKSFDSACQNYFNYDLVAVDAASTDGTYEYLAERQQRWTDQGGCFTLLRNTKRCYPTENLLIAAKATKLNTIIVTLDMDDWLKGYNVLEKLNEIYYKTDCWMTYGTYEESPCRDVSMHYRAMPDQVINTNSFRTSGLWATHLRTFKRELLLSIDENNFKDIDGEFYKMAGDKSVMFSLLESAGHKAVYIPDILYVYNRENVLSEDKVNAKLQEEIANRIHLRQPCKRLTSI